VKGAIKQMAGELPKNPYLEVDGRAEKNAGDVQMAVSKIERVCRSVSESTFNSP
jgi:uncharacterized protein YjbJ (UPF0337 family)